MCSQLHKEAPKQILSLDLDSKFEAGAWVTLFHPQPSADLPLQPGICWNQQGDRKRERWLKQAEVIQFMTQTLFLSYYTLGKYNMSGENDLIENTKQKQRMKKDDMSTIVSIPVVRVKTLPPISSGHTLFKHTRIICHIKSMSIMIINYDNKQAYVFFLISSPALSI